MYAPVMKLHCTICKDETIDVVPLDSVPSHMIIRKDTICPTCRERMGALVPGYTNSKGLWKTEKENITC